MTMAANFEDNYEEQICTVTSEKTRSTYTIKRNHIVPSLWIIEQDMGNLAKDLSGSFTSLPQAKNHIKNYLERMSYTVKAKRDAIEIKRAKEAKQSVNNSASTDKV